MFLKVLKTASSLVTLLIVGYEMKETARLLIIEQGHIVIINLWVGCVSHFRAFPIEVDVGKKTSACIRRVLNMLTKVSHSYSVFGHSTRIKNLKEEYAELTMER
jgi:hypothetical protein